MNTISEEDIIKPMGFNPFLVFRNRIFYLSVIVFMCSECSFVQADQNAAAVVE